MIDEPVLLASEHAARLDQRARALPRSVSIFGTVRTLWADPQEFGG